MNKKKQNGQKSSIRERMKQAADNLKERARNMNEEKQLDQELEQEAETAAAQEETAVDAQALAAQLEEARAQCEEYLDLVQRKQAEFANYRRRTEGIRAEAFDDGRRDTIEKLLPVVDNLERAIDAANEESPLANGVTMVLRQMMEALAKMGVEEINPLGQEFDANLHNAVMQGSEEEGEPGTVCAVLQKGYKLGERVIRHAMVKVVAG